MNKGFADLCLTTWLRRHSSRIKDKGGRMKSFQPFGLQFSAEPRFSGCNTENRKLKTGSSSFRPHQDWSGRRDLNSRPSPWQGDALPLSYSRFSTRSILRIRDGLSRQQVFFELPKTKTIHKGHEAESVIRVLRGSFFFARAK